MTKKTKVQIMLPANYVSKIEDECKKLFTKKSLWFEMLVHNYFAMKESEKEGSKKKIELDI